MSDKPLWKSKTVWGTLIIAAGLLIETLAPDLAQVGQILEALGLALGGIGLRAALRKP